MIYLERIYEFYSEINKKAVEWLWYPYIAYGKITLLQGDPGEGKSSIAVHLSAIITTAGVLPDGTRISKPEHVIYQCSEDGLADTVKPRLEMAKANCDRLIHIIEEQDCLTLEDQRLEETISRTNAKLCIIDPLQAYLGNDMDMMNAVKVRNLLRKLSWIAEKYSCAIVLICHMSKSSVKKSLYRCLGSIDIAAVARSILMVLRDKEDLQLRYLLQIKNNLAEEGKPICFRLGKFGLRWLGTCDTKLEDILEGKTRKLTKRKKAAEEIFALLSNGDMECIQIFDALAKCGICKRTVKMAKKDVAAVSYRKNNVWYWSLDKSRMGSR